MRLWHKDLIAVLPKKQLLGQWSECCAVAGNIKRLKWPNHVLVNRVMDYHLSHFYRYCRLITEEMYNRGINVSDASINKIMEITDEDACIGSEFITFEDLFSGWHDDRYLKQCYYNLQEKYDCGGISETEWQKIEVVVNGKHGKEKIE